MSQPGPEFLVRLRSLPSSIPVAVRLRRFLKLALRMFCLRAAAIEPLPAETASCPAATGGPRSHRK